MTPQPPYSLIDADYGNSRWLMATDTILTNLAKTTHVTHTKCSYKTNST